MASLPLLVKDYNQGLKMIIVCLGGFASTRVIRYALEGKDEETVAGDAIFAAEVAGVLVALRLLQRGSVPEKGKKSS